MRKPAKSRTKTSRKKTPSQKIRAFQSALRALSASVGPLVDYLGGHAQYLMEMSDELSTALPGLIAAFQATRASPGARVLETRRLLQIEVEKVGKLFDTLEEAVPDAISTIAIANTPPIASEQRQVRREVRALRLPFNVAIKKFEQALRDLLQ